MKAVRTPDLLTVKQQAQLEKKRTSRSKLTDRETFVLKKFLKKCIYNQNFSLKGEIQQIVRDMTNNDTINWEYLQR